MTTTTRRFCCVFAVILPQRLKRLLLRHALGWTVADDAFIGFSYVDAETATLQSGSHIGHFNIIRNVRGLQLGRGAFIKDFNHIFGSSPHGLDGARSFTLGDGSLVMSRHYFDLTGAVTIGDNAIVGGRGTHAYTHSLLVLTGDDEWVIGEVAIGDGARVYANAILVPCAVAPGATFAAGAVLTKSYEPEPGERLLIAGNPAVVVGRKSPPTPSDTRGAQPAALRGAIARRRQGRDRSTAAAWCARSGDRDRS
ncbi:MAG: acyltransferase [Solirubrobacteraceae bacterium]